MVQMQTGGTKFDRTVTETAAEETDTEATDAETTVDSEDKQIEAVKGKSRPLARSGTLQREEKKSIERVVKESSDARGRLSRELGGLPGVENGVVLRNFVNT